MKKLISLLLSLVMVSALCVPAFAGSKIETDETTGEFYEEFTFNFGYCSSGAITVEGENFNIETNRHLETEVCGGGKDLYVKTYAKKDNNAIITRIEARASNYGYRSNEVGVTAGEKREKDGVGNRGIIHVDNIDKREFVFDGGTNYVAFDMIRVYYKCNEHVWIENGKCKVCGFLKCDIAGEHIWDNNNKCEACGAFKCVLTGKHTWGENGICEYCGALKCDVNGTHDKIKETHILVKECAYCGKKLSEEVIPFQNAIGSTLSEGNMTIICSVVCLVVGLVGGLLIGKKKKAKTEE